MFKITSVSVNTMLSHLFFCSREVTPMESKWAYRSMANRRGKTSTAKADEAFEIMTVQDCIQHSWQEILMIGYVTNMVTHTSAPPATGGSVPCPSLFDV